MEGEGQSGDVVYLDVEDVIGLYAIALGCGETDAADQLRDEGALDGALARARWHAGLGGADLATQAAVLAHGIAEAQSFIDGNKRAALVAMLTFVEMNGYTVVATQAERAGWMLGFAHGLTVENLAIRLREILERSA